MTGSPRVGVDLFGIDPGSLRPADHAILDLLGAVADADPDDIAVVLFASRRLAKVRPELFASLESHTIPLPLEVGPVRAAAERTWLPRAVRRARIDVLHHATGPRTLPVDLPQIVSIDDLSPYARPRGLAWFRAARLRRTVPEAVDRAVATVVPSSFLAERLVHLLGVDRSRMAVVPWPLPPHPPAAPIDTVRARYGIIGQIVLVSGSDRPDPEHLVTVRAMKHLASRHKETTVVLLGGEQVASKAVQEAVRSLGLEHRVLHLGPVDDPVRSSLVEHAAVVVDLAGDAAFATGALEAMACAVPVVVSATGPAAELVGDAGAVVAPDDEAQLAIEVHRMLDDPEWRRGMVDAGIERARRSTGPEAAGPLLAAYRSATVAL